VKVSIEFIGMQRSVTGAPNIEMPITRGTTVGNAFEYVKKQYPALSLNDRDMFITVNHEVTDQGKLLSEGDVVSFIPAIGGG
jgi:molybdopterin converting factor small subunit